MAKKKVGRPKTVTKKRSRFSRIKRRVSRSRVGRSFTKHKKSISTTIINFIPVIQSVQLISENQVSQATTNEMRFKGAINGLLGSTFDINPFSDAPQAHYNPSIEGAFNKWSITNIGLILGGMVAQKFKLKHANKLKRIGTVSLIPSVIAGILGKNNQTKKDTFNNSISISSGQQISVSGGVL